MWKTATAALAIGLLGMGQALGEGKNYTLTIEGQTYEVAPGESIHAKLKSGAAVDISFDRKAFGSFAKDGVSFEYPSSLSVAETELDKGIVQYAVITAIGSMVVVQRYQDNNAEQLVDFILNEMTKDQKNLGAKIDKKPVSLKLSSGQELHGSQLTVGSGADETRIVGYAADIGKGGVVAISRISSDDMGKDQPMIDRFWASFAINSP